MDPLLLRLAEAIEKTASLHEESFVDSEYEVGSPDYGSDSHYAVSIWEAASQVDLALKPLLVVLLQFGWVEALEWSNRITQPQNYPWVLRSKDRPECFWTENGWSAGYDQSITLHYADEIKRWIDIREHESMTGLGESIWLNVLTDKHLLP